MTDPTCVIVRGWPEFKSKNNTGETTQALDYGSDKLSNGSEPPTHVEKLVTSHVV
jgi:hypothetical protein